MLSHIRMYSVPRDPELYVSYKYQSLLLLVRTHHKYHELSKRIERSYKIRSTTEL